MPCVVSLCIFSEGKTRKGEPFFTSFFFPRDVCHCLVSKLTNGVRGSVTRETDKRKTSEEISRCFKRGHGDSWSKSSGSSGYGQMEADDQPKEDNMVSHFSNANKRDLNKTFLLSFDYFSSDSVWILTGNIFPTHFIII